MHACEVDVDGVLRCIYQSLYFCVVKRVAARVWICAEFREALLAVREE